MPYKIKSSESEEINVFLEGIIGAANNDQEYKHMVSDEYGL